jgi:hypothetical protein
MAKLRRCAENLCCHEELSGFARISHNLLPAWANSDRGGQLAFTACRRHAAMQQDGRTPELCLIEKVAEFGEPAVSHAGSPTRALG